jgi:hypothetical protein
LAKVYGIVYHQQLEKCQIPTTVLAHPEVVRQDMIAAGFDPDSLNLHYIVALSPTQLTYVAVAPRISRYILQGTDWGCNSDPTKMSLPGSRASTS